MRVTNLFTALVGARRHMRRPYGRTAVLGWSIACVLVMAVAASLVMENRRGAFANVVAGGAGVGAEAAPARAAPDAFVDPRRFRVAPPPPNGAPRIAILVRGLGLSETLTADALAKLPPGVTLAFSPYGRATEASSRLARDAGHEIFLDLPVEPQGFPSNDAGPYAVLSSLPAAENARRLNWSLARLNAYPGVVMAPGSPVLESAETIAPLLEDPALDGMVWANGGATGFRDAKADLASLDVTIDVPASPGEIDAALARLEALARRNGSAMAVIGAYPAALDRVAAWAPALQAKGLQLVPVSALSVSPAS